MLRIKQERESEQLIQNDQKEQFKVRNQVQVELDKRKKENEESLKKFRKQNTSAQEHQLKCFISCQKKEYKFNKEKAKTVIFFV